MLAAAGPATPAPRSGGEMWVAVRYRTGKIPLQRFTLSCSSVTPSALKLRWYFSQLPIEQLLEAMAWDCSHYELLADHSIVLFENGACNGTSWAVEEVARVADD